jgi:putative toxin-antitoxin system antitoxin component (TIGR02293 family)
MATQRAAVSQPRKRRTLPVPAAAGLVAKIDRPAGKAVKVVKVGVTYRPKRGVDEFVRQLSAASPYDLIEIERRGVDAQLLSDLSERLDLPATRFIEMLGVPRATAAKKVAGGELIAGTGGQAAIGVARLLAKAQQIVADSTAGPAQGFDAARWLGEWLEVPQPALGGRKPAELLDTPTGIALVSRVLGAVESGAYQ